MDRVLVSTPPRPAPVLPVVIHCPRSPPPISQNHKLVQYIRMYVFRSEMMICSIVQVAGAPSFSSTRIDRSIERAPVLIERQQTSRGLCSKLSPLLSWNIALSALQVDGAAMIQSIQGREGQQVEVLSSVSHRSPSPSLKVDFLVGLCFVGTQLWWSPCGK